MRINPIYVGLLSLTIISNAFTQNQENTDYLSGIKKWHQERDLKLRKADGWLTLAGLFWLEEGENKIGSGSANQIQLPEKAPLSWGTISLNKDQATFTSNLSNNNIDSEKPLSFLDGQPTIISHESLQWHLLKRGSKVGLRLRDTLHESRFKFDSVPYFNIDPTWNIETDFITSDQSDSMRINNVLGMEFNRHPIGYIDISRSGQTHRLSLIDAGTKYFLIFSDATTGGETYGGGRYLYIDKPSAGQPLQVDFNKAENPPCVFTKFATCLLPPLDNKIPFRIEAGEIYVGH